MKTRKISPLWEPAINRPYLPESWTCLEQQSHAKSASTSFIRWGKTHHNAEPQRIFIVFIEHNPEWQFSHKYVVYGGLYTQGGEHQYFNNIKDANAYMLKIAKQTDKWLTDINSQEYIDAYNRRISNMVKKNEE
jgi:hypothetical protein